MKKKDTLVRSSMSIPAVLAGLALATGIYMYNNEYTRQYSSGISHKVEKEQDAGYSGMAKYFFNARKNPATNAMDYNSMVASDLAVQKMKAMHRTAGGLGLNWRSLGPANIGGRTRSIIFDNQDPSGNTMFAGAVSGGIWKSTNLAASWDSVNDNMGSLSIGCMTQDVNGVIYAGTGEGFNEVGYPDGDGYSSGILGNGVYKSTDDGKTFTLIPATAPSISNSTAPNWAYTNRIAVSPLNTQVIYAATNGGLMVSTNGGTSFAYATNSVTSAPLNGGIALDVKVSNDGMLVMACVNGLLYYAYPNSSNTYAQTKFTQVHISGYGAMASAGGDGRIEIAISPTNHDYVYASVVTEFDVLQGVYMTRNAVMGGNGGTWYDIGPGGSLTFNPYSSGGVQNQGSYDNTLGVAPWNPGLCFLGGTTLWSWQQSTSTDTVGNWTSLTTYYGYIGDPTYVHPDMHQIVFDPAHPTTMFVGCDGGIYRRLDTVATTGWEPENRNFDATQFYAIACAPNVAPNGEGVIGGTQDNGSPYISGYQFYSQDGVDLGGGDGSGAYISSLNPNAYYVSADDNTLERGSNLSGYGAPALAYTNTKGLNKGANIDSVYELGSGCFVNPLAVYENPYDTMTPDSMLWIADKSYNAGDTIYPISSNGNIPFACVLKKAVLAAGDSVIVPNYVVSKVAAAFSPSNGVWIMMQGADFEDPAVWMPIGGPLSKPNAFTGSAAVHSMAWSPDGDALFVGTEGGQVFRFSNLNKIRDTSFITGALYSCPNNHAPVANANCPVISTTMGTFAGSADVLSISVDPKNGNNVIVTTGGYTGGTHVYFSSNALSASPTFASAQGNLPEMPVYGSVCDIINSGNSNSALVATEHGVYTTNNITAGSPSWTLDNSGMANTIVCAVKQQTLPPWQCNNSGDIYLGTHGRGAWVDTTFFIPTGIKSIPAVSLKVNMNVYPNPMNAGGTVSFNLPKSEKVTLTIYNMNGQLVKEIPVDNDATGMHYMTISTQDMAVGTYLATLTGTDFRQTTRFIVAR